MKNQNICKFIATGGEDRLVTQSFVLESNKETMETLSTLDNHAVFLIMQGGGEMVFDGSHVPLEVGALVFGFIGESYFVRHRAETEYMYVKFSGNRAEELFRRFEITPSRRAFQGFEGLIPFWRESLSVAEDRNIDLISESVLMYTFSRLVGAKRQSDDIINRVVRLAEENFTDPSLSLSEIADEIGYNVKYLSRSFKERMDIGFSQYLRNLRIKHAIFLMEHGVESVKNIAYLCGFSDPLYFSSVFKETVGVSPKNYMSR
ncbi:MAG: helix-turn-helix transcriptional regulator [Clostridia bacterium]|nr:helix-turn-helix transcriptional regulator [Clostridia bacterium]